MCSTVILSIIITILILILFSSSNNNNAVVEAYIPKVCLGSSLLMTKLEIQNLTKSSSSVFTLTQNDDPLSSFSSSLINLRGVLKFGQTLIIDGIQSPSSPSSIFRG